MQNTNVVWVTSPKPVRYEQALPFMERWVDGMIEQKNGELLWFLEHPPTITAGTSAAPEELLDPDRFPVFNTGRGGRYTYHGPGQRIVYVMLDLNRRGKDLRKFVHLLEDWVILALKEFGIKGETRSDRVGIWVCEENGVEKKIAALGIRLRRWISFHGIALNIDPDLEHFGCIVPCGIQGHGVTSLKEEQSAFDRSRVDRALVSAFEKVFASRLEQVGFEELNNLSGAGQR